MSRSIENSSHPTAKFWRRFAWSAACLAVGTLLGGLFVYGVLLPATGIGPGERTRAIHQRLQQGFADLPAVVVLGNSVAVEGIDAELVADASPGWSATSFAINGASHNEMAILVSEIIKQKPTAIAILAREQELGETETIPLDKAFGYALSGLQITDDAERFRDLDSAAFEALHATKWRAWWHFRTRPITSLTETLRTVVGNTKPIAANEWMRPFQMRGSISGNKLQRHLDYLKAVRHERLASGNRNGLWMLESMAREMHAAGVAPVLVAAPVHPALQQELAQYLAESRQELARFAAEFNGVFVDASLLLDASEFADGQHANADGRAKLSRFVGNALREITPVDP